MIRGGVGIHAVSDDVDGIVAADERRAGLAGRQARLRVRIARGAALAEKEQQGYQGDRERPADNEKQGPVHDGAPAVFEAATPPEEGRLSMSDMALKTWVDEKKERAFLAIEEAGAQLAHIWFEAPELEEVIATLAARREELADAVPEELEGTYRKHFIANPNCIVIKNPNGPGKLFLIRHPGLGWLGFAISPPGALEVAKLLAADNGGA